MASSNRLRRLDTETTWWKFRFRAHDDDDDEDWWFASTAIPLIAATLGPLANVLSIGALVTSWRMNLMPGNASINTYDPNITQLVPELDGYPFQDPHWCYDINVISLVFGFLGNFFLLANFTNRIRYIIALPFSIFCWYASSGLLIAITISMNVYVPPTRPMETYTQGFWYGVIAAVLYLICSMILMVNMLGYFLGHYPQHFNLSDAQRTLILQTMIFFIWLAGGGGVFAAVETKYGHQGWIFTDALYFCDVTILTVGFGDLYPDDNFGRGLVFPYSVGGIIFLGLMIGSISKFAGEISKDKVIKKRVNTQRLRTFERASTLDSSSFAMVDLESGRSPQSTTPHKLHIPRNGPIQKVYRRATHRATPKHRRHSRLAMLQEEKGRFDAMRSIQASTSSFKKYVALTFSVIAFGILWCLGALVFYYTEHETQHLSYFQALYFCYVSLLTIGYGDLAPKSNAGRPFFVVWSILAVPSMTILVSDLGNTVIAKFKSGTNTLADFTVLPKYGIWRDLLSRFPKLLNFLQRRQETKEAKKRLDSGFPVGPEPGDDEDAEFATEENAVTKVPSIQQLASRANENEHELARRLAQKIRATVHDVKSNHKKRYGYEEWVEITELIRFTRKRKRGSVAYDPNGGDDDEQEEDEGLIEWDWIGENSPMMANQSEPEFVLDRLTESMARYAKRRGEEVLGAVSSGGTVRGEKTEQSPSGTLAIETSPTISEDAGEEKEAGSKITWSDTIGSADSGR